MSRKDFMAKNKNLDLFGDDTTSQGSEDNFAAMLEMSEKGIGKNLRNGDSFRGEIISIGKEESFVATGTPVDGLIPTRELLDENNELKYKVGDFLDVVVLRSREGELRLGKKGSLSSSETDSLEDAHDMELPVEGKVTEVCNGGFRVLIQGKTAFCPVSQMDFRVDADHTSYIGKKFDFMITQFEKKGRNIVVSRRKILDLQKAEFEGTFMQKHQPGETLNGVITRLESFGAFVSLENGIEGLVHVSELAWSRIHHPSEVVKSGQTVQVKILKVDDVDGRLKISLSIKQAGGESEPWLQVPQNYPVGTTVSGKVEKKEAFGLFINIAPGITGLLPKSQWRDSLTPSDYENKKRGDEIVVRVLNIDFENRKMSFSLPGENEDLSWKAHTEVKSQGLGTFAELFKNAKK